jgi:DNA-binding response OmpR family regulator
MKKRVLVIDDDPDIRETIRLVLADEGYTVDDAGDGADALALLRKNGVIPDVILLDLMMPRMNGWQFREEQQRDARLAGIPIIVLSADSNLPEKAPTFGGRYLAKPVDIDSLLAAIEAV